MASVREVCVGEGGWGQWTVGGPLRFRCGSLICYIFVGVSSKVPLRVGSAVSLALTDV